jgi:hypothetical protein
MGVKMVVKDPSRPISVVHLHQRSYTPDADGTFDVDPSDVAAMRSHNVITLAESVAPNAPEDKESEIVRLKARLAELEDKPAKSKK